MLKNGYCLVDEFNKKRVSSHRTLDSAIKANRSLQRAVKRHNGSNSYLPTAIYNLVNGKLKPLSEEEEEIVLYYNY